MDSSEDCSSAPRVGDIAVELGLDWGMVISVRPFFVLQGTISARAGGRFFFVTQSTCVPISWSYLPLVCPVGCLKVLTCSSLSVWLIWVISLITFIRK